jgi:hypothetical protein
MEIFNIVNDQPVVTPEGLYIPELKNIWIRDNSPSKLKAQSELATIYHLVDPRSAYAKQADIDRYKLVAEDYMGDANWTPDDEIKDAMEKYRILLVGPAMKFYISLKKGLDALSEYIGNTTVRGGKDGNLTQVLAAIEKGEKILSALEKAEKVANREVQATVAKLKGNAKFGLIHNDMMR